MSSQLSAHSFNLTAGPSQHKRPALWTLLVLRAAPVCVCVCVYVRVYVRAVCMCAYICLCVSYAVYDMQPRIETRMCMLSVCVSLIVCVGVCVFVCVCE